MSAARPAGFELGPAPLHEPLAYPGAIPACSFLLAGGAIEAVDDADPLHPDGPLAARLAALGSTPLSRRHAVLAYGSNRSPAQLAAKFAAAGLDAAVPVLRAEVHGLSVVHHATVTRYGAVPATIVEDPPARTEVAVTFLDDDQAEVIDATEPGQARPLLDATRHRVRLASGAEVAGVSCYRAERPVLLRDGRPVRLVEVASTGSAWGAATQLEVQGALAGLWPDRLGPYPTATAFVAGVRADPSLPAQATAVLRELLDEPAGRWSAVLLG